MANKKFKVVWKRKATEKFGQLFNVDHRRVFRNSKHVLAIDPFHYADGVADFPGYEFNGYFWMEINNAMNHQY